MGQRLGSGDGEHKTKPTRQMSFEPLPASDLFAVGDGADLTLTRSSQGRIELEIRTKHGSLKLGLTEADFACLMFGQAHVSTLVTRYLPKRVTLADSANRPELCQRHH